MASQWLSIGVNALTILVAVVAVGRWFRNWIYKTISEPIARLQSDVAATTDKAVKAYDEARRANDRLDTHLEANSHA